MNHTHTTHEEQPRRDPLILVCLAIVFIFPLITFFLATNSKGTSQNVSSHSAATSTVNVVINMATSTPASPAAPASSTPTVVYKTVVVKRYYPVYQQQVVQQVVVVQQQQQSNYYPQPQWHGDGRYW